MDRWNNRVAIVTGANSGIGKAIAIALLNSGMVVIGIARREDLLVVSTIICKNNIKYTKLGRYLTSKYLTCFFLPFSSTEIE